MALKMLVFDYRTMEQKFFAENKFENYEIKFFNYSLDDDTVGLLSQEDLESTSIVSVFIDSYLSQKVIDSFKNLRIIAIRATGYDRISKIACLNRNIAVLNVQNYGETAVAEFTIGLIIGLVRNIPQAFLSVRDGSFEEKSFVGRDLKELTLGIIGTGAIGAAVCKIAHALGMKILAYDLIAKKELEEKYDVKYETFENVLKNSDVVTLHLPYTGDNFHMFSKKQFEMMKEGSYFINVSRGELVENEYLKKYLESGKIKGAALDVVACETECKDCQEFADKLDISSLSCLKESAVIKELMERPNVIITPHIAYESQDAIDYILKKTFEGISDCINGGTANRVI